jgi:nickel-dependent lactate racemase
VEEALSNPLDSRPFDQLFEPGEKVTIIVPDITRYSGAEIYLPPMIDRLNSVGVSDKDVGILFANGIHRVHTKQERAALVGEEVAGRVLLFDHDARGSDMEPIFIPEIGREILLNSKVLQCDQLIVTGVVSYHYLAGVGGGRKTIMPGVSSFEEASKFHFHSLDTQMSGRHPKARSGVLDGNPLHGFANNVMRAVEPAFALNSVQDTHGKIVEVCAGDAEAVFGRGKTLVERVSGVEIDSLADVVVASCGGHPKDINMVQAHKTYEYASQALKTGGKLFLLAACPDGFGSDSYRKWFDHGGPDEIELALRSDFHINGQTAYSTAQKAKNFDTVMLCDGIGPEDIGAMGIRAADSTDQFISEAELVLRDAELSYVIGQGGFVLPIPAN